MKIVTARGASVAAAVALIGGMTVAGAGSASAVIEGNLETKGPLYYCESGNPQMVIYARTVKQTDTVSYTSTRGNGTLGEFTPEKEFGLVYSRGKTFAGADFTVNFKTKDSGDSLAVNVSVPSTCAGLPNGRPESGWQGQEVDPNATATETSTETSTAAPTSTDEPSGPPVETGYVADDSNASTLALIGLLTAGVVGAGAAATTRLKK